MSLIQSLCFYFARKTNFLFPNVWKTFSFQKIHWNMVFVVLSRKMVGFFPKIWSYFFSLEIWYYPSAKKVKMISPKKVHWKMTLLVSLKKVISILEKITFLLIEKLKMIKRVIFIKNFQWLLVLSLRSL